jgi:hypothetical protein
VNDYYPIFTNISEDVSERWERIRGFIEAWYTIKIPEFDCAVDIENIENDLGCKLPISFRSYITISKQLLSTDIVYPNGHKIDAYSRLFRDDFEIASLENHQAISLMMRGEADFYYGVKNEELHLEDPSVHGYLLDYKNPIKGKFDYYGRLYPSITSFILSYLLSHLPKDGSSRFYVTAEKNQATLNTLRACFTNHTTLNTLRACFTNHTTIDNLEIFESKNILAFLEINPFEQDSELYILRVYLRKELGKEHIPDELLEYAKKAFFAYGIFSELN